MDIYCGQIQCVVSFIQSTSCNKLLLNAKARWNAQYNTMQPKSFEFLFFVFVFDFRRSLVIFVQLDSLVYKPV